MQNLFDPLAVRRHRARIISQKGAIEDGDFLFRRTANSLTDRLLDFNRTFARGVDSSVYPIRSHLPRGKVAHLWKMALSDVPAPDLTGDQEFFPFGAHSLDLILSHLSLHWSNDLLGTLLQLKYALKPDGLLLASLFGGNTLAELRQALALAESDIVGGFSPRVAPMADLRQVAGLLQQAGFSLPVVDSETILVTYRDFYKLLRDLRHMGETNALKERPKSFTRSAIFARAAEIYRERFSNEEGQLLASFEIFYLTGWAPHPSQQQPARRGSGQVSLGDFLKEPKNGANN